MGELHTRFFAWFNLDTGKTIIAYCYESYVGLRGQERIGLVDRQGRVHHFDSDEMTILSQSIAIPEETLLTWPDG